MLADYRLYWAQLSSRSSPPSLQGDRDLCAECATELLENKFGKSDMSDTQKYVLITGASSGIGMAFARHAAQMGHAVGLSARREDRLQQLANELSDNYNVSTDIFVSDLCEPDSGLALASSVLAKGRKVDVLINNAGFSIASSFAASTYSAQREFLELTINTPVALTHALLPGMLERNWGRILNISSITALSSGGKGHTLYPAGKSFLLKFSQSLHAEVAHRGVHVSAILPGFVATEFQQTNGMEDEMNGLPHWMVQRPEQVVTEAWRRNENGTEIIATGMVAKTMAAAMQILPETWMRAITRKMAEDAYVGD
ncbi:MAG: dehydrogenase [Robiginitomaculum sp.]|nr:MAG: dehydrogenase [Robiginitomaculum sp.]